MNKLIKVETNEKQEPVVSGRELHEKLEVKTLYKDWFPRMCEYGFIENIDFVAIAQKRATAQGNETTYFDHILKLDMAKEIAMLQRNEKGKQIRKYFIEIEKEFNSPEKIMARALYIANEQINNLKLDNKIKEQQIIELQPKALYYDLILQCKDLLATTTIAKDYGMSAKGFNKLLHELGVQYNQSGIWFLYQKYAVYGYTQTKTNPFPRTDGTMDYKPHMYWTQKGRLFLYGFLKEKGILPIIEKEQFNNCEFLF